MRRVRHGWFLLAVPALVLRALIPPGFMPVAAEHGFALEFCPGAAALPPGAALLSAHAHHHHEHGGGHPGEHSSPAHHAPCVFAASALLGPLSSGVAAVAADTPEHAVERPDSGARLHVPSIVRAQSPRAPPA